MERDIKEQNLDSVVDEIMTRKKFNFKFESMSKRFFSCFDKEVDEKLKEIRGLADIKFQNELDVSRILRKIRNFESMAHFMLSDRQKYLLRFHSRQVIDSDSDLVSFESDGTLFSNKAEDNTNQNGGRILSKRHHVMTRVTAEEDFREENCALRLINQHLETGIHKHK